MTETFDYLLFLGDAFTVRSVTYHPQMVCFDSLAVICNTMKLISTAASFASVATLHTLCCRCKSHFSFFHFSSLSSLCVKSGHVGTDTILSHKRLTVLLSTRVPCLLTALLFTHRQPKIETCVIQCTTQKQAARSTILCRTDSIRA
jgi:hypothetical protein